MTVDELIAKLMTMPKNHDVLVGATTVDGMCIEKTFEHENIREVAEAGDNYVLIKIDGHYERQN